jgi:hypothetical protein
MIFPQKNFDGGICVIPPFFYTRRKISPRRLPAFSSSKIFQALDAGLFGVMVIPGAEKIFDFF